MEDIFGDSVARGEDNTPWYPDWVADTLVDVYYNPEGEKIIELMSITRGNTREIQLQPALAEELSLNAGGRQWFNHRIERFCR